MNNNKNEDIVIIICTTPYSKRLPQKCFLNIASKSVLSHILYRIQSLNIKTFLAIDEKTDNFYREKYYKLKNEFRNLNFFFGHSSSPLHRMQELLLTLKPFPKYVIRVTHDDILIDIETINQLIKKVKSENAGYGFSPKIIEGAGVEIIHTANIIHASQTHSESIEFVSYFVKGINCPVPSITEIVPRETIRRSYQLSLDYYEDYIVLETVLRKVGWNASCDKICSYLDIHPEILHYNKKPTLSFYTCVRNGEKWIKQAIYSIIASCNVSFEYIIVDDNSTDNTLEEILFIQHPNIKIIINSEHLGLASSSNIALNCTKGKYVMRVDCDDILRYNAVEKMIEKIEQDNSIIVYANYNEIDELGKIINPNSSIQKYHHAGCALMSRQWINEVRFKDKIQHWDSLELFIKAKKDKIKISYINEPLWHYRLHPESLSHNPNYIEERKKCKPKGIN